MSLWLSNSRKSGEKSELLAGNCRKVQKIRGKLTTIVHIGEFVKDVKINELKVQEKAKQNPPKMQLSLPEACYPFRKSAVHQSVSEGIMYCLDKAARQKYCLREIILSAFELNPHIYREAGTGRRCHPAGKQKRTC